MDRDKKKTTQSPFKSYFRWTFWPPLAWLLLFFLFPFIVVLGISFSEAADAVPPYKLLFSFTENPFSLHIAPYVENYKLLWKDSLYVTAYLDSVRIAFLSTLVAILIGYPIAYGIARAPHHVRLPLLLLVLIPFWTSLLIRVYAWILLLKNNGIINNFLLSLGIIKEPITILNTELAVIIGIVYAYLPFFIIPLYNALEKINPALLEAAQDLGCRPLSVFWRVTFPLSLPGIIAGSLLVFIPAVGEFMIPDLLGGSRVLTIGRVLWNEFFLNRDWPTAAAVTILMTLVLVLPIVLVQRILGKREQAA